MAIFELLICSNREAEDNKEAKSDLKKKCWDAKSSRVTYSNVAVILYDNVCSVIQTVCVAT